MKWILFCVPLLVGNVCVMSSCNEETRYTALQTSIPVQGVSLPASVAVAPGGTLTLDGSGVEVTDFLRIEGVGASEGSYELQVTDVAEATFSVVLPDEFRAGTYALTLVRGAQSLPLGQTDIRVEYAQVVVPDKEGMTVKGRVTCEGRGVAGVVVSDGFEVTQTDDDGIYYLPSEKANGYVFISVPGGYEADIATGNQPQFFRRLTASATMSEQQDFVLHAVDNTRHKLFVMADFHLADRTNDLVQYDDFLNDVNSQIAAESLDGARVYGVTLGDLSWDLYWYSRSFALPEAMQEIYKVECPVFNLPGNHDNDPYVADDWRAEQPFKDDVCPTYYSFNLGDVHYVVLDNIRYINTGASEGTVGDRDYNAYIVPAQIEWLKKDLAYVTDKSTPIVVCMHINLHQNPIVSGNDEIAMVTLDNGAELKSILSEFSDVQVLTGHTHINFTVEDETLMEHNTAAVCATWWWTGNTGYAGNHICKDGSPGGYAVWSIDGRDMEWYYKGTGCDRDYQFRTYDLNETYITAEKYAPNSTDEALSEYAGTYATKRSDNKVLINVWGYDSAWKVEVTEDGRPLEVRRVWVKDPLHIISYEALRLNAGSSPTSSFVSDNTGHMFEVTASAPDTPLEIRVTDRFGRVYTETMQRPKALSCDMK